MWVGAMRCAGGHHCLCPAQDGWTPLHIAAQEGHQPCVAELADRGADLNQANKVRGSRCGDVSTHTYTHPPVPIIGSGLELGLQSALAVECSCVREDDKGETLVEIAH